LKPRQSEEGHAWKSAQTALNFELDLVLEKPGVVHDIMVEEVLIREASEQ
jgi:hypothetical protein